MSIESVMPSNYLILCHPLHLPSVFPRISLSNELTLCIKWEKYWSFRISPSNEYSGLVSFKIDWSDLLGVQGTLKSLLPHHSSKASIMSPHPYFSSYFLHGTYLLNSPLFVLVTLEDKLPGVRSLLLVYHCL